MGVVFTALQTIARPTDFRRIDEVALGKEWISYSEILADDQQLDQWVCEGGERYKGMAELTGSMLGSRLSAPAIDLAVSLLVAKGWAVPLPAAGVMMRFSERGATNGAALLDKESYISSGDIHDHLAAELNALLTPLIDKVAARTRYRQRGLWGDVCDQIAIVATRRSRHLPLDIERVWQDVEKLIHALGKIQPFVRIRPRPFVANWPGGGKALTAVRGTCCLYFKMHDHKENHRFCGNCPLLPDEPRRDRVSAMLEREHALLIGTTT